MVWIVLWTSLLPPYYIQLSSPLEDVSSACMGRYAAPRNLYQLRNTVFDLPKRVLDNAKTAAIWPKFRKECSFSA